MREVLQDRKQIADAADGKSGTDGVSRGDAAAGGRSVGDGGDRLGSWSRAKGQPRTTKWEGEGDEQDLRSLKRNEEEVLSLAR